MIELTKREAVTIRDAILSVLAHVPHDLHGDALEAYRKIDYAIHSRDGCPCDSLGEECRVCSAIAENREANGE